MLHIQATGVWIRSKAIVGVAPNAVITYVSKLYPGAISDKDCTAVGIIESFCAWGYDYGRQGFSNSRYSAKWCFS